jgi:3-oxoadipate enol-lactonase
MPQIKTASTRLFYRWDGPERAPVLVLAHALGASHAMWDANIPALTHEFRVLRYDSRGHGSSDVPPGPYDIKRLARDVVELLDALELDTVDFCGLSMGGMAGIWLGANASDRIRRLILSNTCAHLDEPGAMNTRIEAVRTGGGMAAVTDAMLARWFTPHFRSTDPTAAEHVRRMLLSTPVAGYIATCQAVRDMDLRGLLDRIAAPTLVIAGARDPATPPEHSYYLRDHVRGARLVELQAAHVSNIEAAAQFNTALLEFLGGSNQI